MTLAAETEVERPTESATLDSLPDTREVRLERVLASRLAITLVESTVVDVEMLKPDLVSLIREVRDDATVAIDLVTALPVEVAETEVSETSLDPSFDIPVREEEATEMPLATVLLKEVEVELVAAVTFPTTLEPNEVDVEAAIEMVLRKALRALTTVDVADETSTDLDARLVDSVEVVPWTARDFETADAREVTVAEVTTIA